MCTQTSTPSPLQFSRPQMFLYSLTILTNLIFCRQTWKTRFVFLMVHCPTKNWHFSTWLRGSKNTIAKMAKCWRTPFEVLRKKEVSVYVCNVKFFFVFFFTTLYAGCQSLIFHKWWLNINFILLLLVLHIVQGVHMMYVCLSSGYSSSIGTTTRSANSLGTTNSHHVFCSNHLLLEIIK